MSYVNKQTLKGLLNIAQEELFDKKTIDFVFRSISEALVEENVESVVFLRILNSDGLDGIIKRLNYLENCSLYNYDYIKTGDFGEVEFVMVSSSRFNAVLIWDYSNDENKKTSKIFVSMNSDTVTETIKVLKGKIEDEAIEKFNTYKPERRTNKVLNLTISKIISKLNENIVENTFTFNEIKKEEPAKNYEALRGKFHEIKNQLSIIDIQTEILSKKFGEANNLSIIKNSIQNILDTLNDIKNPNKTTLFKKIPLNGFLDDIEGLSIGFLDNGNKIKIANNSNKNYILGDEKKLNEVLLNVIKNATECTKNDEIKLIISDIDEFISIIIENHGDKILDQNQDKIFDKNYTTKEKGWGVGLYECKKYMEDLNGSIELLKSNDDMTQFIIKILGI